MANDEIAYDRESDKSCQQQEDDDHHNTIDRISSGLLPAVFGNAVFSERAIKFSQALPLLGDWFATVLEVEIGHDGVHWFAPWNIAETFEPRNRKDSRMVPSRGIPSLPPLLQQQGSVIGAIIRDHSMRAEALA